MSPRPLLFREVVNLLLKIEVKTTKNSLAGDLFTEMGLSVTQFRSIINDGLLVKAIGLIQYLTQHFLEHLCNVSVFRQFRLRNWMQHNFFWNKMSEILVYLARLSENRSNRKISFHSVGFLLGASFADMS